MLRFLWLMFLLLAGLSLPAQSPAESASANPQPPVPDARLFEAFDSVYVFTTLETNPALVRRWNFYLDHAFVVMDFPPEKGDIAALPVVKIANPDRFNILLLEQQQPLARDWEKPTFYRINQSQQVLMYFPGKIFMERLLKE